MVHREPHATDRSNGTTAQGLPAECGFDFIQTQPRNVAYNSCQGMLLVPKVNPSEASHAVDAQEALPKMQKHDDRPDGARLTGDGLVPKTIPKRCW